MNLIGKLQPLIIIGASVLGLLLGIATSLDAAASLLIEPFLMALLYIVFLTVDLRKIGQSLRNNRYTLTAVTINFIVTPIVAFVLGKIFFASSIDIRIGLLMLLVTPCTDWYLVFTGLSHGNVELNMSILPLNLVFQILLLPVYLLFFMHSDLSMDIVSLLQSVVFVLIIPFALSYVTKIITRSSVKFQDFLAAQSDNLQLLFLCLAVICMFASEGKNLTDNLGLLLRMFVPLLIFFCLLFCISQIVGRAQHFKKEDIIALNFTTLARNSPLSLAIAVATFPDRPLIALALVIGPLIELPVLSLIAGILGKW